MIYDCFLFRDELELLELRLKTHESFADRFVLCEAPLTYDNRPKPLHYTENVDRFSEHASRIHALVADELLWPVEQGPFVKGRERIRLFYEQQDALIAGLVGAGDDDVVLLSDADEFARPSAVEEALALLNEHDYVCLNCSLYYYFLNGFRRHGWRGPLLFTVGTLRKSGLSVSRAFFQRKAVNSTAYTLRNAGWHFSYLGGADRIVEKLRASGHWRFAKLPYTDEAFIKRMVDEGRLFQDESEGVDYIPLDDTFPEALLANAEHYSHLIKEVA